MCTPLRVHVVTLARAHAHAPTHVCVAARTAAHEVLVLEKEAREAMALGRYDKAVVAATDAKLALDSDALMNVNMMVRVFVCVYVISV
jgi:hypothetical protein